VLFPSRYRASDPSVSCVALRAIITTLRSDAERLSAVSMFVSSLADLEENWAKLLHGLPETEALTMKKVLVDHVKGKRKQGEGPVVNYEGSTKQAPHPSHPAGAQQHQQQQVLSLVIYYYYFIIVVVVVVVVVVVAVVAAAAVVIIIIIIIILNIISASTHRHTYQYIYIKNAYFCCRLGRAK
jgi:hypothetical protein